MANYIRENPFDPNYALPANVRVEPPGRGTVTSRQLPRRTIDRIFLGDDAPYNPGPGYSVGQPIKRVRKPVVLRNWTPPKPPAHSNAPWNGGFAVPGWAREPWNGAAVTKQLPRRTVDTMIPNFLGDVTAPAVPFQEFGQDAASVIADGLLKVPPRERSSYLRQTCDALEPGLFLRVRTLADAAKKNGTPPGAAVRGALAAALSSGLSLSLRTAGEQELSGFSIGSVTGAVADAGKFVAGTTADAAKYTASKVGSLACKATTSKFGSAATVGAASIAGPGGTAAGAAGVTVARGLCQGTPIQAPQVGSSVVPNWMLPKSGGGLKAYALPLAVAAGGIGLLVLLKKKGK